MPYIHVLYHGNTSTVPNPSTKIVTARDSHNMSHILIGEYYEKHNASIIIMIVINSRESCTENG